MRVLIVYASKYGSTGEVASAIEEVLTTRGKHVDTHDALSAPAPTGYDAVIVGSGVYVGSWLKAAASYLETHAEALRERPVWLFGVGPLGFDDPQPAGDPDQAPTLVERVAARAYVTFTGALDRSRLSLVDRMITRVVKAPDGDFRDWGAIRAFAHDVADALETGAAAPVSRPSAPVASARHAAVDAGGRS
ncbi:MAG: flavodoxin [Trueperaceae bacterium]|nr:MAG: flavodoxin [Trueperaceae bacterium]